MESEDLFVETPEYAEELEAVEEPAEQYDDEEIANQEADLDEGEDADGKAPDETNPDGTPAETNKSNDARLIQLPLSRIKALMKLDSDFSTASSEAVFLVAKATELFIESLAKESFIHTAQAKKRTVQKRDVDQAIESVDALMFLEGTMTF